MSENKTHIQSETVKFNVIDPETYDKVKADQLDKTYPLESYLTQANWNKERVDIDIPSVGKTLSAHADLNGDGKITNREFRTLKQASEKMQQLVSETESRGDDNSGVTTHSIVIDNLAAQSDDNQTMVAPDGTTAAKSAYLADFKTEVDIAKLPKLTDSRTGRPLNDAEKIRQIEKAIDIALGSKREEQSELSKLYQPDGKLTKGELEFYNKLSNDDVTTHQVTPPPAYVSNNSTSKADTPMLS